MGPSHDLRDLDRAEGAAMHMSVAFEESIDWSEPLGMPILSACGSAGSDRRQNSKYPQVSTVPHVASTAKRSSSRPNARTPRVVSYI